MVVAQLMFALLVLLFLLCQNFEFEIIFGDFILKNFLVLHLGKPRFALLKTYPRFLKYR